jgi:lipopolysaccharide export system permease protein
MMGRLDRYILSSWLRIFALGALGFPLVAILINLVDNLDKLLDRGVTAKQIAMSYVYSVPENLFLVLPAAVLVATVFTVGSLGRHSEITAAKASGRSFHRLIVPIVLAAIAASGLTLWVGEISPASTQKMLVLQKEKQVQATDQRFNFVYRAERGWVYAINTLDIQTDKLRGLMLERRGTGPAYPTLVVLADSAVYDTTAHRWNLQTGSSRVIGTPTTPLTFSFASMRLRALAETPADLLAEPKAPEEMNYAELGRYITAMARTGSDTNKLRVERALKIAVPLTCLIIALFGAPLAVTTARAGTAWGIAVSLGTTLLFLLFAQLAKAIGAGGVMLPEAAAWMPNALFFVIALVLLVRVRT